MPLILAPINREMEVKRLAVADRIRKHLLEIGITIGSKLTLVSSSESGVIVVVKEGRLCLDGATARRILVA